MKFSSKKSVIVVFLVLVFLLAIPKPALAITTFEVNPLVWAYNIITSNASIISAAADAASLTQKLFEWAFKIAAESLKRQLLNMIVDQIVTWIQGGGNPKFITDWPGFFRDAVDQAGGRFLKQLGLGLFCSPFNLTLRAAFIPIPRFSDRSACTLSQVGINLDNFLKDFSQGGWVAWNEMVLKPQNNIYGAYLMAWDQYEIEKSAAQKAAEAEAQAGRGFLSVRRCAESHAEIDHETGESITVCDREEIVTPGAVVGDLAAKAVGSDIDYIVNAQDFAAYVAAITNAVLNRMFAEGIGLLRMAFSGSGGGGGGGGGGPAQCAPFLGTPAYNDCIAAVQTGIGIREFQKKYLISLIDQDLTYQNQLLGAKQATLTVLNQSITILNQLKDCQGITPPALAQVQSAASIIASQITQIQSDIIALQIKQQEIKAVTDVTQIPSLWAQVAGVVNPASTYSLVLAAQQETYPKQQDMNFYQQQLTSCQQQQQQSGNE